MCLELYDDNKSNYWAGRDSADFSALCEHTKKAVVERDWFFNSTPPRVLLLYTRHEDVSNATRHVQHFSDIETFFIISIEEKKVVEKQFEKRFFLFLFLISLR